MTMFGFARLQSLSFDLHLFHETMASLQPTQGFVHQLQLQKPLSHYPSYPESSKVLFDLDFLDAAVYLVQVMQMTCLDFPYQFEEVLEARISNPEGVLDHHHLRAVEYQRCGYLIAAVISGSRFESICRVNRRLRIYQ